MSQNTVLDSQGAFPPEYTSHTVPPELDAATTLDPVRSLAESWHRQAAADWATPVRRPFDAQYWACWLVAAVFPALVAYLLLAR